MAQDERRGSDNIEDFPFMLRLSKHSESFSATARTSGYHRDPTTVNSLF